MKNLKHMYKKNIGLIALFLFAGCATQKNAEKYYNNHPEELARKCSNVFQATDSIGEKSIMIIPGNGVDYSGVIDSLMAGSENLLDKLHEDSSKAAQVSAECGKIV
jgi:hypothetical protein